MAYTIISQNNSTTTLSDGVNTITVPSRVNLTSGNFTIVEVNNNMATLEDGDGNVYRDIPCVATLAGEGGGGGSGLPDQTGHSGEFLTTDGTDASWAAISALQNTATGQYSLTILGTASAYPNCVNIGHQSEASAGASVAIGEEAQAYNNDGSVVIGYNSRAWGGYGVAIGWQAESGANNAIQLGNGSNNDANTFKVGNANGNYEIMSANGTIPTARLTKVNATITLTAAGWSNGSQTVTVTGMTATGVVLVSPDPTDQSAYTSAGILCTAQAADSLTFTATTTPTADIDVNVVML